MTPPANDTRHHAATLKAEVAQVLGRTLLFYRRPPSLPKINLPQA